MSSTQFLVDVLSHSGIVMGGDGLPIQSLCPRLPWDRDGGRMVCQSSPRVPAYPGIVMGVMVCQSSSRVPADPGIVMGVMVCQSSPRVPAYPGIVMGVMVCQSSCVWSGMLRCSVEQKRASEGTMWPFTRSSSSGL